MLDVIFLLSGAAAIFSLLNFVLTVVDFLRKGD